jgi:hypothetical protein
MKKDLPLTGRLTVGFATGGAFGIQLDILTEVRMDMRKKPLDSPRLEITGYQVVDTTARPDPMVVTPFSADNFAGVIEKLESLGISRERAIATLTWKAAQ